MSTPRTTRILCAAAPGGSADALERLASAAERHDVQAIAVVDDLGGGDGRAGLRAVFGALGSSGLPGYWVPGGGDAPVGAYLRETHTLEVVFPLLHGVHGTAAYAPDGHVVFAGFGGEIDDDPDAARDETERLRYPRWEPEYRLKILSELSEHQLVLLFATPPAHKGLGTAGSDVVAELIATHRPRLVVCGGERGQEMIGRSMVVAPGSLVAGHYAVADLHERAVQMHELAAAAG